MDRRVFLWTSGCVLAGAASLAAAKDLAFPQQAELAQAVLAAEKASGGRLGLSVIDTGSGARFAHRGGERFAMCSTFKLLLVTAVLCRVDMGHENLSRRVAVLKADILGNSPFSESRIASTASLAELAEATITLSDNTAANLLLPAIGGPAGLTAFLRRIGDSVTRSDRPETDLGAAVPGDPRDTTTPDAMAATVRKILLGDVLKPASRLLLEGWLRATKTGAKRLRAGLPADWQEGDKTGTGEHGTTNDVAILWPPGKPPLIVASFLTESPLDQPARQAILARIGKAIAKAYL